MAYADILSLVEDRYVHDRSSYCSRYEKRVAFVKEALDESEHAHYNAREFQT